MKTEEGNQTSREEGKEEVTVLIVINDSSVQNFLKNYFKNCDIIAVKSKQEAIEKFEKNKLILDFVVVAGRLHDTRIDTIDLVKKMRADTEFKGQLVAVGNYIEEMVGIGKCNIGCPILKTVEFLQPLITTLKAQKISTKEEEKIKNNLRVA